MLSHAVEQKGPSRPESPNICPIPDHIFRSIRRSYIASHELTHESLNGTYRMDSRLMMAEAGCILERRIKSMIHRTSNNRRERDGFYEHRAYKKNYVAGSGGGPWARCSPLQ